MDEQAVLHGARLEHGDGAGQLRPLLDILEKDHVVREVRDSLVGDAPQLKQVRHLDDEHQADARARESLGNRENPFPESNPIAGRDVEVAEAVDHDPRGSCFFDQVEQLVDPFVDVHADDAPGQEMHAGVLNRPAEAAHDPAQLRLVLVKRGQDPGLAGLRAVVEEVKAHQRLADARRPRDQGRRPLPEPAVPQQVVQGGDPGRAVLAAERVPRIDLNLSQAWENLEAALGDAIGVLARAIAAPAQLHDLDHTHLALGHLLDVQGDDPVGDREFRLRLRLLARVGRVPDRRRGGGRQAPDQTVEKLPEGSDVARHRVERAEAVDDHDRGANLAEVAVNRVQDLLQAALAELLPEVLVDHAALDDRGPVEEGQRLAVAKDLVQRLGKGGQVERRSLNGGVVERDLLTQDRLAAAGNADDQVDGVLQQTAVQYLVESLVPGRQPLGHRWTRGSCDRSTSALVPRRSRTVETRARGSRGLRMKAAAPDRIASSALSIADTATIWPVWRSAHSPRSRKPAPPEMSRSMATISRGRSSKCSLACVASSATTTSHPSVRRKYSARSAA